MKCKGTELIPRHHQTACLFILICFKFRQLGTPTSNQFLFWWALSTSSLVGAASSCIQRFEAPSSSVLSIFIAIWNTVLSRLICWQSPSCSITTASEYLYRVLTIMAMMKFVMKTDTDIIDAVMRTTLRRLCHVLQVRAIGCLGSTWGNHGASRPIFPKRRSWSSDVWCSIGPASTLEKFLCKRLLLVAQAGEKTGRDGSWRDRDGSLVQLQRFSFDLFHALHDRLGCRRSRLLTYPIWLDRVRVGALLGLLPPWRIESRKDSSQTTLWTRRGKTGWRKITPHIHFGWGTGAYFPSVPLLFLHKNHSTHSICNLFPMLVCLTSRVLI